MPEEKELKELAGKYRRALQGKDGEAILQDLATRCFEDITTFSENYGRFAFNEGRRSVFKYIKNILSTDLDTLKDLPREYQTKAKEK